MMQKKVLKKFVKKNNFVLIGSSMGAWIALINSSISNLKLKVLLG